MSQGVLLVVWSVEFISIWYFTFRSDCLSYVTHMFITIDVDPDSNPEDPYLLNLLVRNGQGQNHPCFFVSFLYCQNHREKIVYEPEIGFIGKITY